MPSDKEITLSTAFISSAERSVIYSLSLALLTQIIFPRRTFPSSMSLPEQIKENNNTIRRQSVITDYGSY